MAKYLDDSGLAYLWSKLKAMLAGKQATLVSGTNIKTINNESVLGSGNITISGGGGTALTTQEIEDAVDAAFVVAGYNVTITLTNPSHPSYFERCDIYEYVSSDPPYSGELIGGIDSPTGSGTFFVPATAMGVVVEFAGGAVYVGGATVSTTGGVELESQMEMVLLAVTADGTATISGVDYDF